MTNEIATYTIGVIGLESAERRVLSDVVCRSDCQRPSFRPFDKSRGGCPDLIMVDADRPSAIQSWNRFRRANAHHASCAPIFVGSNLTELPCPDPYVLHRPILPTHLFDLLRQVVREVHGLPRPAAILDATTAPVRQEKQIHATSDATAAIGGPVGPSPAITVGSCASGTPTAASALVVDDSLPVRVQMRKALTPITSRLDFAASGARALEMVAAHPYTMIFLDCTLPGEDAYELCGAIKKHSPHGDPVVVMMTNSSSPADRVMGTLAGFDNYLVKPIQTATLRRMASELAHPAVAI